MIGIFRIMRCGRKSDGIQRVVFVIGVVITRHFQYVILTELP